MNFQPFEIQELNHTSDNDFHLYMILTLALNCQNCTSKISM